MNPKNQKKRGSILFISLFLIGMHEREGFLGLLLIFFCDLFHEISFQRRGRLGFGGRDRRKTAGGSGFYGGDGRETTGSGGGLG